MGRPAKGARLYLYARKGREPTWIIRDGTKKFHTFTSEQEEAARHLAAYVANPKHYARKKRSAPITSADAAFFIYFIEVQSGERPVKIGIAKDVKARLWNLAVGSPFDLAILASCPGGLTLEARVHTKLSSSRIRGEWFHRTPDVESAISAALTGTLEEFVGGPLPKRIPRNLLWPESWRAKPPSAAIPGLSGGGQQ